TFCRFAEFDGDRFSRRSRLWMNCCDWRGLAQRLVFDVRTLGQMILGAMPCIAVKRLEPISKSPEEDNEASELYEAEEVLGVVFPTDEDAALPLNPSKEALHEPASHIAAQPSPILRGRLASVAAMRRDHLDAVLAQLLIEWIAIVGAIANQILRLGLD